MPATALPSPTDDCHSNHVDLLGRANQCWHDASFAEHEQMLVDQCSTLRFFRP